MHYDPGTGVFTRLVKMSPNAHLGVVPGERIGDGYLAISVGGKRYYMHRLAWFYMNRRWPDHNIDHINGDRTDNRISNLRDVTQAINLQNIHKAKAYSSTGLLGVSKFRDRFKAEIRIDGIKKHIGVFLTAELAHQAYMAARRDYHAVCGI